MPDTINNQCSYQTEQEQRRYTRKIWQRIKQCIDPVEYGYRQSIGVFHDNDTPTHAYQTSKILEKEKTAKIRRLQGKKFRPSDYLAKYNSARLFEHFYIDGITHYYTSRRKSYQALIGFDVDCHNGEQDCGLLVDMIDSLFGSRYWETSTNGRGIHGYILVDKRFQSEIDDNSLDGIISYNDLNLRLRDTCIALQQVLRQNKLAMGIAANIEIKGYSGWYEASFMKRGLLMKIPMLTDISLSDEFFGCAGVTLDELSRVAGETDSEKEQERGQVIDRVDILSTCTSLGKIKEIDNNISRQNAACRYLARRLGRVPELYEFMEFYMQNNIFTGEIYNPKRLTNLQSAIDYTAQTFDPAKTSMITLYECRQAVEHITDRDIEQAKSQSRYKRNLSHSDLSVCLFCMTKVFNKNTSNGIPRKAIEALWKKMKNDGQADKSFDAKKYLACRYILDKSEILHQIKDAIPARFSHDGQGHAAVYAFGSKHPLNTVTKII